MIRISPVRLIDEKGEQIGIIETPNALQMAKAKELDLIEINPNSRPPVCKILDWGKYQYLQAKKEKKNKQQQKRTEVKGVRIRPSTGENDLNFKLKQVDKFLSRGNKVKIEIILRGRENAFRENAKERLRAFVDKIENTYKIDQDIQKQFNGFNMVISPEK